MKLRSIQFLRAWAILLVTYTHSVGFQAEFAPSFQQHFFFWGTIGAIGVDLFFVISGFIITWSAGKYLGVREGWEFLVNRFHRLVPVYYAATLLFLGVYLHHMLKVHAFNKLSFAVIMKTLFLLPIFDRTQYADPLLVVAWTLSFEWLFYLFFFAAIFFSVLKKEWFLCSLILFLVAAGIFFPIKDYRLTFLTNPILLEFLAGIMICWLYVSSVKIIRPVAWLLIAAGLTIFLYVGFTGYGLINEKDRILNGELAITRLFKWGILSTLIVAGCIFLEKDSLPGKTFTNPLITLIGDASYSIYLTHFSVFGLLRAVYVRVGSFLNPDLAIFVHWSLTIIVGILFYKWVETPLLEKMKSTHKKIRPA